MPTRLAYTSFVFSLLQEQRIQDYVKAYQTSGRPPQPVPQTPTDAGERLTLGLPPLFEPYVEQPGGTIVQNLTDLPEAQLFTPVRIEGDPPGSGIVVFHNIVLQKEFCHFSTEVSARFS